MPPIPRPTDPRRELQRHEAILRRQAVFDRLAATRSIVVGSIIALSCVLVGYLDANARPHRTATSGAGLSGLGVLSTTGAGTGEGSGDDGSTNSGGSAATGASQGQFGAVAPPSASAGGAAVISGGS
ncbi:MAG TPA: hypothetical protein VFN36_06300 [Solirubrobacteraceae bacterium]|nr:hypothetical protein [Solirubrobacteraceae bacterium]